jgi:hypothetical protein
MPKHHDIAAPDLTGLGEYGFNYSGWPFHSDDQDWDRWSVQLHLARLFLGNVRVAIGECGLDSGTSSCAAKHAWELWVRTYGQPLYLPNGALIVAAQDIGLPIRRLPDSPNVLIALSHKRIARAMDRWRRQMNGEKAPKYTTYDRVDRDLVDKI